MSRHIPIPEDPTAALPGRLADHSLRKLRVTVVHTSIEGTVAALNAAATYASTLSAQIVLCVPQVVYFRYALDRPPVPRAYFERLCAAMVQETKLNPYSISMEVHPCRSELACLAATLQPHSVVIVGSERRWWRRRERRLASALIKLGHDVLLVYAGKNNGASHAKSVARHMLGATT